MGFLSSKDIIDMVNALSDTSVTTLFLGGTHWVEMKEVNKGSEGPKTLKSVSRAQLPSIFSFLLPVWK